MDEGSYWWAREQHAAGKTVTCGFGIRPGYSSWSHQALDLPMERTNIAWQAFDSICAALEWDNAQIRPADVPRYFKAETGLYRRLVKLSQTPST